MVCSHTSGLLWNPFTGETKDKGHGGPLRYVDYYERDGAIQTLATEAVRAKQTVLLPCGLWLSPLQAAVTYARYVAQGVFPNMVRGTSGCVLDQTAVDTPWSFVRFSFDKRAINCSLCPSTGAMVATRDIERGAAIVVSVEHRYQLQSDMVYLARFRLPRPRNEPFCAYVGKFTEGRREPGGFFLHAATYVFRGTHKSVTVCSATGCSKLLRALCSDPDEVEVTNIEEKDIRLSFHRWLEGRCRSVLVLKDVGHLKTELVRSLEASLEQLDFVAPWISPLSSGVTLSLAAVTTGTVTLETEWVSAATALDVELWTEDDCFKRAKDFVAAHSKALSRMGLLLCAHVAGTDPCETYWKDVVWTGVRSAVFCLYVWVLLRSLRLRVAARHADRAVTAALVLEKALESLRTETTPADALPLSSEYAYYVFHDTIRNRLLDNQLCLVDTVALLDSASNVMAWADTFLTDGEKISAAAEELIDMGFAFSHTFEPLYGFHLPFRYQLLPVDVSNIIKTWNIDSVLQTTTLSERRALHIVLSCLLTVKNNAAIHTLCKLLHSL